MKCDECGKNGSLLCEHCYDYVCEREGCEDRHFPCKGDLS